MGYTHYWRRKVGKAAPRKAWAAFAADARVLLAHPEVAPLVCWESDEADKPPEIGADCVRFNGKGEDGHETMCIDRKPVRPSWDDAGEPDSCDFCKTARKPYDPAACAVLLLAAKHLPGIAVSSDGDWGDAEEWIPARELFARVFPGYDAPECPWPVKSCPKCSRPFAAPGHNWWFPGEGQPCGKWREGAFCYHCGSATARGAQSVTAGA